MVSQNRIRRNISEGLTHNAENFLNFALHAIHRSVPHKMINYVTREVDCINFLNAKQMSSNVVSNVVKLVSGNKNLQNVL